MMRKPILLLFGVVLLAQAGCSPAPPASPPKPPEVVVVEPVQRDVPVTTELVGQALGSQDVELRARVEGYLDSVNFTEGTLVKKGQLLYRIDPKPFEANVANAKANLATWQARYEKTDNDVKRYTPLAAQQAVSQMELDNAVSSRDAASAQVDAGKAAVDTALLNLGYTTITAPVDGLIGLTKVKPGNLVGRGESTLLTTISIVNPIFFRVGVAEAEYLRIARGIQEQTMGRLATVPVQLVLADGTVHPYEGRFNTVERNIDPTTGTLALQISFPNPGYLVRPGQYGRIRFNSDVRKGALLVPQRAVQELQNLYSLAVVGPDSKVSFRNVKVGPRVDSLWVIEEGLKPGERVVVEGLQRVREGAVVTPKPMTAAAAAPAAGEVK
ncbi:MAG: bepF [Acidobacteria bacterium]|nr:bepF [Acidobacteriota bacterium]